jgi:F-type H+-transporting ATPase subunit delta
VRSREIARRYASALYQVSTESANSEAIAKELGDVATVAAESDEVRRFLGHPLVSREEKSAFLERVFPEVSETMQNFLELVVRNRRETYLEWICREFVDIQAEAEGQIQVEVRTAHALDEKDTKRLSERLQQVLHHPVQLTERIDPELMGGLRIETDGRVLDATIRARLDELRKRIEE